MHTYRWTLKLGKTGIKKKEQYILLCKFSLHILAPASWCWVLGILLINCTEDCERLLVRGLAQATSPTDAARMHEQCAQVVSARGGGPELPQFSVIAFLLLLPPVK